MYDNDVRNPVKSLSVNFENSYMYIASKIEKLKEDSYNNQLQHMQKNVRTIQNVVCTR